MTSQNHLQYETSPYLLEHANNPVDWYPWGEQVLEKARQENKPILLSIGYSACHWCHVMAHESFSDPETAQLMNQWYINIKVDREERPDLDKIYQTAHQFLTNRPGGWPLTVFLTPDKQIPFYAGTYFPLEESHGRPSFKTLLTEVAHFYYQRRDAIERVTKALYSALQKIAETSYEGIQLSEMPITSALDELEKSFDFIHGGFGRAPKFPLPTHLHFLMQTKQFPKVEFSLTRMAQGGLQDQLGGGFFRYCVDSNWMIPHFEKMLYDNAQLIEIYAQMSLIKENSFFKETALAALSWVLREMHSTQGGFFSSLNADSEGVEGKYYYWDREEIRQILTHLEYTAILDYFALNKPPNFEGHWHLYIAEQDKMLYSQGLTSAKQKLLSVRQKRVHPSCDRKILTSWNALMIKAMATVAQTLDRSDMVKTAEDLLDFIKNNQWVNQRLLAVFAESRAHTTGLLDDYAFLFQAILQFLQVRWRNDFWQWAIELAEQLLKYFYDENNGGFYFTPSDHENLIQRPKIFTDEATPSANGVLVQCFLRLGNWLGEKRYLEAGENTLRAAWHSINLRPSEHDSLLMGLQDYFNAPILIILRGEASLMAEWQKEFFQHFLPQHDCFAISNAVLIEELPEAFQKPVAKENAVTAYICQATVCREIIHDRNGFVHYLQGWHDGQ